MPLSRTKILLFTLIMGLLLAVGLFTRRTVSGQYVLSAGAFDLYLPIAIKAGTPPTSTPVATSTPGGVSTPVATSTPSTNPGLVCELPSSSDTPTPLIPQASNAGYTPGQFSVNESGAAMYKIDVVVPPGTGGMNPQLSLAYDSRAGDSLVGVGWSLAGLSSISRCPTTLAQHDFVDGVDFDDNDQFCLDGQLLVGVQGDYGRSGTIYRTENESFAKITSSGSAGNAPQSFKVWSKAGLIMEYGVTSDSRIEAQGRSDVLVWAVNKIADTKGNYLSVSYQENNPNGEYYPTRIDYTGNAEANLTPYNSVRLSYETRPDVMARHVSGSVVKMTKRLTHIQSFAGNDLVRNYQIAYETSMATRRSRVVSVTECNGDGDCFPATEVDWATFSSANFNFNGTNSGIWQGHGGGTSNNVTGDFNGDGLTDIAGYTNQSGQWHVALSNGRHFNGAESGIWTGHGGGTSNNVTGDFNGDGLTDIAGYTDQSGQWHVTLSSGTSFNAQGSGIWIGHGGGTGNNIVGDFNGDGLTDIAGYAGNSRWHVTLSTGTNFNGPGSGLWQGHGGGTDNNIVGDFNGDGLTDIAGYTGQNQEWHVTLSTGANFNGQGSGIWNGHGGGRTNNIVGDFNGDGLTDIAGYAGSNNQWHVTLSTGRDFNGQGSGIWQGHGGGTSNNITSDFNGDGLTDIAGYTGQNQEWHVTLSTGTNFNAEGSGIWQGHGGGAHNNIIGDFNGNGKIDIAGYTGSNNQWHVTLAGGKSPDLLTKITNGQGVEIDLEYKPLTDETIYTKSNNASYPYMDMQMPLYVVVQHSSSNGLGGVSRASYEYGGLKAHLRGRGFAGFEWMKTKDEQTGIVTTTYYRQVHPFKSMAWKVEQHSRKGFLLSRETNSWAVLRYDRRESQIDLIGEDSSAEELEGLDGPNIQGVTYFPYGQTTVTERYELDGTFVTSSTTEHEYDSYGNPTKITITHHDGYRQTTVNTYDNNPSRWHLGRLLTSEVTAETTDGSATTRNSSFEYDPVSGLLIREVEEPGTSLRVTKFYEHDRFGNIVRSTISGPDITDHTQTSEYDSSGRFAISSSNAEGHTVSREYHARFGQPTRSVDANGLVTTWEYDGFGRQTRETRADGTQTIQFYRLCQGNCPQNAHYYRQTETSGASPVIEYVDLLDRPIRRESTGFDGRKVYVDTEYNARGEKARISDPYYQDESAIWTTYTYDDVGRLLTQTDPDGSVMSSSYQGLTTRMVNALNQTSVRTLNSQGWLVKSTDNLSNFITYTYDGFGNLTQVVDPAGNMTTMQYDRKGRKTSMSEPDMGTTTYQYNTIDQLISQTDAKGQTVTISYDRLGRMTQRIEPEGTTTWVYDTAPNRIGKLAQVTGADGYNELYIYDNLSRLAETRITIDGQIHTVENSYDEYSRVKQVCYPTGFTVQNDYNNHGYLNAVRHADNNRLYWQADQINARGQLEAETLGNNVTTNRTFDPLTGRLSTIDATQNNGTVVQGLAYEFDRLGNLLRRSDNRQNINETFTYDALNRLTRSEVTGQAAKTVQYDDLGNITSRSDVGSYIYGQNSAGPHAVTRITGAKANNYTYDANGNRISSANGSVEYTSFNKPRLLREGNNEIALTYGPNRNRYKKEIQLSDITKSTIYIGGLYEADTLSSEMNSLTWHKHYISGGNGVIAIYTEASDGAQGTTYLHKDHLGSLDTVTDQTGNVTERLSFDAWGKRRQSNWQDSPTAIESSVNRGFTGHEHLDEVGLIHMNGRVYDPEIGRFLSADPFVQAPGYTQSLNRYTYVNNNPLSYTDPSGFSLSKLWKKVKKFFKKHIKTIITAVVTIATAGWASGLVAGFWGAVIGGAVGGFTGGFTGTLLHGGSFSQALTAGLTGAVIGGVTAGAGKLFGHSVKFGSLRHAAKTVADGLIGGVRSKLGGGKFAHGFFSSAFRAAVAPIVGYINEAGSGDIKLITEAVVGGTAAELGGGKFANGAVTAAFGRLLKEPSLLADVPSAIGKIWNLPNTVVGLTWGLAGVPFGAKISFGNNAIQFENHIGMITAITLGNTISYAEDHGPNITGAHERQHTFQGQQLGPLYLPSNGIGLTLARIIDGNTHGQTNWNEVGPQCRSGRRPWGC